MPKEKAMSSRTNMQEKILSVDQFGSSFNFKLPGGENTYNTLFGASLSIILGIILILYGAL